VGAGLLGAEEGGDEDADAAAADQPGDRVPGLQRLLLPHRAQPQPGGAARGGGGGGSFTEYLFGEDSNDVCASVWFYIRKHPTEISNSKKTIGAFNEKMLSEMIEKSDWKGRKVFLSLKT